MVKAPPPAFGPSAPRCPLARAAPASPASPWLWGPSPGQAVLSCLETGSYRPGRRREPGAGAAVWRLVTDKAGPRLAAGQRAAWPRGSSSSPAAGPPTPLCRGGVARPEHTCTVGTSASLSRLGPPGWGQGGRAAGLAPHGGPGSSGPRDIRLMAIVRARPRLAESPSGVPHLGRTRS